MLKTCASSARACVPAKTGAARTAASAATASRERVTFMVPFSCSFGLALLDVESGDLVPVPGRELGVVERHRHRRGEDRARRIDGFAEGLERCRRLVEPARLGACLDPPELDHETGGGAA